MRTAPVTFLEMHKVTVVCAKLKINKSPAHSTLWVEIKVMHQHVSLFQWVYFVQETMFCFEFDKKQNFDRIW